MRLWPFSSAACEKLSNERGMSGRGRPFWSRVMVLNSSEIIVKWTLSVRKKSFIISKRAPPKPAWPEVYEGNGGVKFVPLLLSAGAPNGCQVGSPCPIRYGFPDPKPLGPV